MSHENGSIPALFKSFCSSLKPLLNSNEKALEELEKILPYYIDIIYLEAPLKSLCNRINNRKQDHRIKNKIDSEQKEFCFCLLFNKQ